MGDNMIQQLLEFSDNVTPADTSHLATSDPDVREAVQAAQLHDQVSGGPAMTTYGSLDLINKKC
jgi:hypothetical protein